jgi:hypothetical protein
MRGGVQPVYRFPCLVRGFTAVRSGRGNSFACLLHPELGSPERGADLWRYQRVFPTRLPHLFQHLLDAFLYRRLFSTSRCVRRSGFAELLLYS